MAPMGYEAITALCEKKEVTIVITDSGLGGMAILANIVARLKTESIFQKVSLIYYNAWPEQKRGYNRFTDINERVRIFDQALTGMKRYRPDIIMIACNTLSVLYGQTMFSHKETIPVIDIVRFGVGLVFEALSRKAVAKAVLLGTVTTIASEVHRSLLIERGISPDRLISQPCDQLATSIEKGPASREVTRLVDTFMDQAAEKIDTDTPQVFAALFCTHFGYCQDLIRNKLESSTGKPVTVLNPNEHLAASLFKAGCRRHAQTTTEILVVSRITWDQIKIDAITEVIEKQSPETATALRNYEQISNLFTF